jgi:hypothetical protein
MSEAKVHVRRNLYGKPDQPWLVTCELCAGDDGGGFGSFLSAFMGAGVKGWAPTWQVAQDYAHRHAVRHEETRCPLCLHVPATPLVDERTSA